MEEERETIIYDRIMGEDYITVRGNENGSQNNYQARMIAENELEYFLECSVKQVDCCMEYRYRISSMASLEQAMERRTFRQRDIRRLIVSLDRAVSQLEEYLLSEEKILLDPGYIYMDSGRVGGAPCEADGNASIYFCYYPEKEESFTESVKALLPYILKKTDHGDREAILLAYSLYQISLEDRITMEDLKRTLDSPALGRINGEEPEADEIGRREREPDGGKTGAEKRAEKQPAAIAVDQMQRTERDKENGDGADRCEAQESVRVGYGAQKRSAQDHGIKNSIWSEGAVQNSAFQDGNAQSRDEEKCGGEQWAAEDKSGKTNTEPENAEKYGGGRYKKKRHEKGQYRECASESDLKIKPESRVREKRQKSRDRRQHIKEILVPFISAALVLIWFVYHYMRGEFPWMENPELYMGIILLIIASNLVYVFGNTFQALEEKRKRKRRETQGGAKDAKREARQPDRDSMENRKERNLPRETEPSADHKYSLLSCQPDRISNIPVNHFPFIIGRKAGECDFQIMDTSIRKQHAKLERDREEIYVTDFSAGATFVDGQIMAPGENMQVFPGQEIRFSDFAFIWADQKIQ